jgi:2,3-bisphosphoglycerate-independent phosphoglycerate mutase
LFSAAPLESRRASLLALDACLGVPGLPQSATGQTVLLTGQNVPALLGYHYGPKPNPPVAEFLANGNLFSRLCKAGRRTAFLNAFPPGYFDGIHSGKRMYAAIAQAAVNAGLPLGTLDDLRNGRALSADFTAQGWRERLGLPNTPVLSPFEAGQRLAELATRQDFSLFEYWLSDYAGHGQDMQAACGLLESFDQVLEGLLAGWDDAAGLILLTSDHGNLEDLSTRRHTANPVPALVIGARELRRRFTRGLHDLTEVAPAIMGFLA